MPPADSMTELRARSTTALLLTLVLCVGARAQDGTTTTATRADKDIDAAVATGVSQLLAMQEGEPAAQWPYEGVYREDGEIPPGYRVGGTSLCALALLEAPGWDADEPRRTAVERAARSVIEALAGPAFGTDIDASYDVRGWGWECALQFLVRLQTQGRVPALLRPKLEATVRTCIADIQATELPRAGGWNYARSGGWQQPGPAAPFMTAPTLQALFAAAAAGYATDADVIRRGLDTLEAARTPLGSVVYGGVARAEQPSLLPGAVGRMLVTETTLAVAGRGSIERVRAALDAFLAHHAWLELRRGQKGTHVAPWGIAPYYVMYAHEAASRAIELLPAADRGDYRNRLRALLLDTRGEDGRWNDRVFPRTANYGTAMAVLALVAPERGAPVAWSAPPP